MDSLISVIVPIYRVEEYLPHCIDSILKQSYKNLEIILVDDGSPDRCPQICDEYAAIDNRIRVIHQDNKGLSGARNAGLDIATGEYISFIDSDDWASSRMMELLYRVAEDYCADIVSCGIFRVCGYKETPTIVDSNKVDVFSRQTYLELITFPSENIRFEVWNKLFRRNIIDGIRFKEGQVYEDIYFERMVSSRVTKFARLGQSLYYYRENRVGATNSFFKVARMCVFEELRDFYIDLKYNGYELASKRMVDLAMDFAQQFYIALNNKDVLDGNKKEVVSRTLSYFDSFYSMEKSLSLKYKIFHHFPKIYYILWKFREFFHK